MAGWDGGEGAKGGNPRFEVKSEALGTSLAVQWLRLCSPVQGAQVRSLVGELRTHMPGSQKPKHEMETVL